MALLVTEAEAGALLDLDRAVALTEDVFREYGRGQVESHSPYHLGAPGGVFRFVTGALNESRRVGIRCGPRNIPGGTVAVLYDGGGTLLAIVGYPFATLRTAATVAVSLKHLARADARRLGLVGTGSNALGLLKGAKAVRPITEIVVFSRDVERRRSFCDAASRELALEVRPVETLREAVSGRDIVITSTSNRQPLFPFAWLDRGTHLSSMGPIAELGTDCLLECDRIVVSSRTQEENYFIKTPPFPLVELIAAGKLTWEDVGELGDVILGRRPGRATADEITLFHESQGGFGDVAFAAFVHAEALRRGLGREFSF